MIESAGIAISTDNLKIKKKKIKTLILPDPQTTNTKSARSHGPTGYFSSCGR